MEKLTLMSCEKLTLMACTKKFIPMSKKILSWWIDELVIEPNELVALTFNLQQTTNFLENKIMQTYFLHETLLCIWVLQHLHAWVYSWNPLQCHNYDVPKTFNIWVLKHAEIF
jgi:hypothetical protein